MTRTDTSTDAAMTSSEARALVEYLRDRDVVCPLCHYNLRGLDTPRCPECGRQLELRVGLTEPRQGAWLAALISSALPAGIGVLLLITLLKDGWPEHGSNYGGLRDACFGYYIASVPIVGALVRLRRRYLRLEPSHQTIIAVSLAVAAAIAMVGLVISD